MAERVVLVCDVCGKPAAETVSIRVGRRSLQKDLCSTHLSELTTGARAARRGRPRSTVKSSGPGRPRKKSTARRRRTPKSGSTSR